MPHHITLQDRLVENQLALIQQILGSNPSPATIYLGGEMVDTTGLKPVALKAYRFNSCPRYHILLYRQLVRQLLL